MNSDKLVRECELSAGLRAFIHDETSHYYGGYYHVRLQVTAEVPICGDWFGSEPEHEDALRRLGPMISFKRSLEKMAVPSAEVDSVRNSLLKSFETNVLSYLMRPDFASRFVLGEYQKACRAKTSSRYYHS
jgi:hypothetical protein